eukprot:scaffold584_cov132-Cylindrotheca_fusiformis.AAC.28
MTVQLTDKELEQIENLPNDTPTGPFPVDPYRRSSGHFGFERPGAMDEFKKRRSWRPKEAGSYTPKGATHKTMIRNAPHTAPAASKNLSVSKEFREGLYGLHSPGIVTEDAASPAARYRKRPSWQHAPSTPTTSPMISTLNRRRTASTSSLSPAMEKRLSDFSKDSDQIPPAFLAMQRRGSSSSRKPSLSPKNYMIDVRTLERVSPRQKEVLTPKRLKKIIWPPVRAAPSVKGYSRFEVTPGTVRKKRTSFEIKNGSAKLMAPPLTAGDSSTESPISEKPRSIRKRQASLLIRWTGPTYRTVEGHPLYDEDSKTSSGHSTPFERANGRRFEVTSESDLSPLQHARQDSDDSIFTDRPNVWVAPADTVSSVNGKWKVKRVWYKSSRDRGEKEIMVDDAEIVDTVKQLLGVPANLSFNTLQTDEEGSVETYDPALQKWKVKAVYDTNGEIQGMNEKLMLDEEGLVAILGKLIDEQMQIMIEDFRDSGSGRLAQCGFREGDSSNHSIEDASKWIEIRRAALNASQSTCTTRGVSETLDDDEESFASERHPEDPPGSIMNANWGCSGAGNDDSVEGMSARWGYSKGGSHTDDDEKNEFTTVGRTKELTSAERGDNFGGKHHSDGDNEQTQAATMTASRSPNSDNCEPVRQSVMGARWGYGLGGSRRSDDENELVPAGMIVASENDNEQDSAIQSLTGAKWGYGLGGSRNSDDENELIPEGTSAASKNHHDKKGSVRHSLTQAKWRYVLGGSVSDEEEELVPAGVITASQNDGQEPVRQSVTGAKWGYGLGGSRNPDDENELMPVGVMAASQNGDEEAVRQTVTGTEWEYSMEGSRNSDDENEPTPIESMVARQNDNKQKSVRRSEPTAAMSEDSYNKKGMGGSMHELQEDQQSGDFRLAADQKKKKKKKKKKKRKEEEERSLYELLCRDSWFSP